MDVCSLLHSVVNLKNEFEERETKLDVKLWMAFVAQKQGGAPRVETLFSKGKKVVKQVKKAAPKTTQQASEEGRAQGRAADEEDCRQGEPPQQ